MGVGRCESWGPSNRSFLIFCGASTARAHTIGSGSGGDFFFLDREREGRVGETCLL